MENSNVAYWAWFLFIGGVIGWLAGIIVRGRGFGIIADIVIGIIGAMLGREGGGEWKVGNPFLDGGRGCVWGKM